MVFKTTFGQSQRWSLIRDTLGVENEETNNLNLANKAFNRQNVFILGGLNSGISLYFPFLNQLNMKFTLLLNINIPTISTFYPQNRAEHEIFSASKKTILAG